MNHMNKKTDRDIEILLETLVIPQPDALRMNEIRNNLQKKSSPFSSLFNLSFISFFMQRQTYIAGVFIALLTLVMGGGGLLLFSNNKDNNLSDVAKRAVFEKILSNNPQIYQNATREANAAGSTSELTLASDAKILPLPYLQERDYNYQVTKTTITNGAAA